MEIYFKESYINSLKNKQEYNVIKSHVDIYKFVIMPMNNNGYFHSDIKDNNILVKQHKLKVIDFGLLIKYDNTSIHPRFLNHSLHHLMPYSVLLFHNELEFHWELFYSKHKHLEKSSFIHHCAGYIKEKIKVFKEKKKELFLFVDDKFGHKQGTKINDHNYVFTLIFNALLKII